jgi:hypothetical protein
MTNALIDDLRDPLRASNGARWQLVSDAVMGGVSRGALQYGLLDGRYALRMSGVVSLENNGGFLQMAIDLDPGGATIDASAWQGIALTVRGDGADYGIHLRTRDVQRPWQSYRARFVASATWQRIELPFANFLPHRLDVPLDIRHLRRLGLVAIGSERTVDLAIAELSFF